MLLFLLFFSMIWNPTFGIVHPETSYELGFRMDPPAACKLIEEKNARRIGDKPIKREEICGGNIFEPFERNSFIDFVTTHTFDHTEKLKSMFSSIIKSRRLAKYCVNLSVHAQEHEELQEFITHAFVTSLIEGSSLFFVNLQSDSSCLQVRVVLEKTMDPKDLFHFEIE